MSPLISLLSVWYCARLALSSFGPKLVGWIELLSRRPALATFLVQLPSCKKGLFGFGQSHAMLSVLLSILRLGREAFHVQVKTYYVSLIKREKPRIEEPSLYL